MAARAGRKINRVDIHTGSTRPEGRDRTGRRDPGGGRKTHSSMSPSLSDDSLSLYAPPPPPLIAPESARPIRNRTRTLLSHIHTEACRTERGSPPACQPDTRGPDAVKLTACALRLRLRVGRPIGGASARDRMEPSSSPTGGDGRGSVRPVRLNVVAGFGGGRWRGELALLRGHSGVGSRPADPGGAAVAALARRLGRGGGCGGRRGGRDDWRERREVARPGGCGTGGRRKREEDRKINKELGMDGWMRARVVLGRVYCVWRVGPAARVASLHRGLTVWPGELGGRPGRGEAGSERRQGHARRLACRASAGLRFLRL